jgi:hypothetical protein
MAQHHSFHFFVDAQKYDTDKSALTGAEIKAMVPGFNPTFQLYLEEPGDQADRPVSDAETITLDPAKHGVRKFYSVPPATFG